MILAGMRIGLLTASASRLGGGVFEAVVQQAALIRAAGGEARVFALHDGFSKADRERFGDTPVENHAVRGPRQPGWAPGLVPALIAADLDVLHLHGIWLYPSYAGGRWAKATGRPYLISPHGMLDRWIIGRGRAKKVLARWGYERASWCSATAFHALTEAEAADIARETGRADSVITPNAAPAIGPRRTSAGQDLVYLGRIHPKKNLPALLAAWGRDVREGTLTIAGWGEAADVAALEQHVVKAGSSVRFVGAVHGAAKQRLLEEARLLVLPSFSEGLPMVVLEAWAAGTPVVMTPDCHLPQGFAAGAALPCGHDAASISASVGEALMLSHDDWLKRSRAAQALAAGPFSGASVSARWIDTYGGLAA